MEKEQWQKDRKLIWYNLCDMSKRMIEVTKKNHVEDTQDESEIRMIDLSTCYYCIEMLNNVWTRVRLGSALVSREQGEEETATVKFPVAFRCRSQVAWFTWSSVNISRMCISFRWSSDETEILNCVRFSGHVLKRFSGHKNYGKNIGVTQGWRRHLVRSTDDFLLDNGSWRFWWKVGPAVRWSLQSVIRSKKGTSLTSSRRSICEGRKNFSDHGSSICFILVILSDYRQN